MIKKQSSLTTLALVLLCLCVAPLAQADTKLEDLAIMALGPLDGRVVVKDTEGKMHVLNVGDAIPGTKAKVLQILPDKLETKPRGQVSHSTFAGMGENRQI